MNKSKILREINYLNDRLEAFKYVRGIGWSPAKGKNRIEILSQIKNLKAELPRAKYDQEVAQHGWKSVERNA
jgi:hypothetical protein